MIIDNSPALGNFVLRDRFKDQLRVERTNFKLTFEAKKPVLVTEDEIVELVAFMIHELTQDQKTALALKLLGTVSFANVLNHFGMETPK